MAVNKVVINRDGEEKVIMDVTDSTVTPETLAEGETAYDKSGARILGTMKAGSGSVEWDDIKNNPFTGNSNTISWASRGIDPTMLPVETWVKMSDAVVTWKDVENFTEDNDLFNFIWTEGGELFDIASNGYWGFDPFFQGSDAVVCLVTDVNGNTYEGVRFQSDGVYFFTGYDYGGARCYPLSVTVPGFGKFETYEPIDNRYMPEGLQTETVTLSDTLVYESIYDDNDMIDPVKAAGKKWLGVNIKVSDANIPVKAIPDRGNGWRTLGEGKNEWGWYQLDVYEIENGFFEVAMTDENGNTYPAGYCATDDSAYDTGLYLFEWGDGRFTCSAGAVFEVKTPKSIDKKYLPDDIGMPEVTEADNGKFLRVVDGVWAAASILNAEGVSF